MTKTKYEITTKKFKDTLYASIKWQEDGVGCFFMNDIPHDVQNPRIDEGGICDPKNLLPKFLLSPYYSRQTIEAKFAYVILQLFLDENLAELRKSDIETETTNVRVADMDNWKPIIDVHEIFDRGFYAYRPGEDETEFFIPPTGQTKYHDSNFIEA